MEDKYIKEQVNTFLKVVAGFINDPAENKVYVESKHEDKCKVCKSHPVNYVGTKKIICRQCGTSHIRNTVLSEYRDFYSGEVLLDLRDQK